MKFVLMCVLRNNRDKAGSDSCNQNLIDLCTDLLSSLDILDPGASRNRGKILKDLASLFYATVSIKKSSQ
jgi:hypothetical protein